MKYNSEINRLRGIAVALTVYQHEHAIGWPWLNTLHTYLFGDGGVVLFFVISGFVISASLEQAYARWGYNSNTTAIFWIKRFTRIFPQAFFWVIASLTIVILLSWMGADKDVKLNLYGAIAAITNIYNFFVIHLQKETFVGQYWSLSLEEQFYIVFPFFLLFVRAAKLRLILLACALFALNFVDPNSRLFFKPEGIIFGIIWYEIFRRLDLRFGGIPRNYAVAACLLLVLLLSLTRPLFDLVSPVAYFLVAPGLALCMVALASLEIGFVPGSRILDWLGSRSYAIYLCHFPFFLTVPILIGMMQLHPKHYFTQLGLGFAIGLGEVALVMCASELSFRFIEQPLRSRGKRYAEQLAAPHPAAGSK